MSRGKPPKMPPSRPDTPPGTIQGPRPGPRPHEFPQTRRIVRVAGALTGATGGRVARNSLVMLRHSNFLPRLYVITLYWTETSSYHYFMQLAPEIFCRKDDFCIININKMNG